MDAILSGLLVTLSIILGVLLAVAGVPVAGMAVAGFGAAISASFVLVTSAVFLLPLVTLVFIIMQGIGLGLHFGRGGA
jgi:hypothetical protein